LTEKDGRLYGRGAADDKSGVVGHLASLRLLGLGEGGVAPLNIKICFEGEEECDGSLERYVALQPEMFAADVYLFADGGNLTLGQPCIESSMRGAVVVDAHIKTIAQALHSGLFGGAAPDAFIAFSRMLEACYDDEGMTHIPGVEGFEYSDFDYPEDLLRRQIAPLEGVEFAGAGSYASRMWSRPALSVIGLDMPSIAESSNIIIPEVKARLSMRIPPKQNPQEAIEALKAHLRSVVPFNAQLELTNVQEAEAFYFEPSESFMACANEAFETAFGAALELGASGGSIPLLTEFQKMAPQADFLVFGAEDVEFARIHGGNESVEIEELRKAIVAETLFLQAYARTA
jgi:acetylornithine deacetylase/succinyl-diaminopimelate desuccinylase-like protein